MNKIFMDKNQSTAGCLKIKYKKYPQTIFSKNCPSSQKIKKSANFTANLSTLCSKQEQYLTAMDTIDKSMHITLPSNIYQAKTSSKCHKCDRNQIKYSKRCWKHDDSEISKSHSQRKQIKNNEKVQHIKKMPLSSVNIFQQNQQFQFLREHPALVASYLSETNSYSKTLSNFAKNKIHPLNTLSQTLGLRNHEDQSHKYQRIIYTRLKRRNRTDHSSHSRSKNKSPRRPKSYNNPENIELSVQKKCLTVRPSTCAVIKQFSDQNMLQSASANSNSRNNMKNSAKNKRTLIKKQRMVKKEHMYNSSFITIGFPKKVSEITPWD